VIEERIENIEDEEDDDDEGTRWARHWLAAVALACMRLYTDRILEIGELSVHGRRQLTTDIKYPNYYYYYFRIIFNT